MGRNNYIPEKLLLNLKKDIQSTLISPQEAIS